MSLLEGGPSAFLNHLSYFMANGGIADRAQAERLLGVSLRRVRTLGSVDSPDDIYEPLGATFAATAQVDWEWSREGSGPAIAELRVKRLKTLFCIGATAVRGGFKSGYTVEPQPDDASSFIIYQTGSAPTFQIDVSVDASDDCVSAVRLMQRSRG